MKFSWKDIKISQKLYIGFGVVLVLAIAIGWSGYTGLTEVGNSMENFHAADNLVKHVKDAAAVRKDFLATHNTDNLQQVLELGSQMKEEISFLKRSLDDKAELDLVAECDQLLDRYLNLWKEMIDGEISTNQTIASMNDAAAECDRRVYDLFDTQRKQLEQDINANLSADALRERMQKMVDASAMVSFVGNCRFNYMHYLNTSDIKYANNLYSLLDTLTIRSQGIKKMMTKKDNLKRADGIIEIVDVCIDYLDPLVKGRTNTMNAQTDLANDAKELVASFIELGDKQTEKMDSAQASAITMAVSFVIGAVLLGMFVAFFISRGISRPVSMMAEIADQISVGDVNQSIEYESKDEVGVLAGSFRNLVDYMKTLAGAAERIADNDLTVDIEPKSESDVLGNSFKTMTTNLRQMIRQLADNAKELVSAATEIASASEEMSRGANDQADQVGQVSTAIEEMTATIVESSKNAGEASDVARGASDTANSGNSVVAQTIQGLSKITESARNTGQIIGELATASDKIGEIIGVIDDIADQTNLLALNAAIEAARAGEQGRGFAVVADEVRKLAERTGKATGEITDMIKGIQKDSNSAVEAMNEAGELVSDGQDMANQAGDALNEILGMTQKVMDMIQMIATASEEQSTAAEQISKNIEQVSSITKETATGAEQSAAAAEELNRQAEGLREMVSKFTV